MSFAFDFFIFGSTDAIYCVYTDCKVTKNILYTDIFCCKNTTKYIKIYFCYFFCVISSVIIVSLCVSHSFYKNNKKAQTNKSMPFYCCILIFIRYQGQYTNRIYLQLHRVGQRGDGCRVQLIQDLGYHHQMCK